jgi:hypothetical protein
MAGFPEGSPPTTRTGAHADHRAAQQGAALRAGAEAVRPGGPTGPDAGRPRSPSFPGSRLPGHLRPGRGRSRVRCRRRRGRRCDRCRSRRGAGPGHRRAAGSAVRSLPARGRGSGGSLGARSGRPTQRYPGGHLVPTYHAAVLPRRRGSGGARAGLRSGGDRAPPGRGRRDRGPHRHGLDAQDQRAPRDGHGHGVHRQARGRARVRERPRTGTRGGPSGHGTRIGDPGEGQALPDGQRAPVTTR